ncbi:MAG TPA: response regulator [Flavisolibacter sp.]|jgi:CheY-like chemotaxis protein|nr:response regulator [Flavisolibacter sp.]
MESKHLIVYADDDIDDLNMFQDYFDSNGTIKILPASDGLDALEILEQLKTKGLKPCLVILDINMPLLNGKETLLRIKSDQELQRIPVVLFSTSKNPDDNTFASSNGVDFISKPLSVKEIELIANMFIDRCNFEINNLSA